MNLSPYFGQFSRHNRGLLAEVISSCATEYCLSCMVMAMSDGTLDSEKQRLVRCYAVSLPHPPENFSKTSVIFPTFFSSRGHFQCTVNLAVLTLRVRAIRKQAQDKGFSLEWPGRLRRYLHLLQLRAVAGVGAGFPAGRVEHGGCAGWAPGVALGSVVGACPKRERCAAALSPLCHAGTHRYPPTSPAQPLAGRHGVTCLQQASGGAPRVRLSPLLTSSGRSNNAAQTFSILSHWSWSVPAALFPSEQSPWWTAPSAEQPLFKHLWP